MLKHSREEAERILDNYALRCRGPFPWAPWKVQGNLCHVATEACWGKALLEDACREYIRRCEAKRRKPFDVGDYVRAVMPRSTEERNRGPIYQRRA